MEAGKKQTGHFSISAYDGTLDVDSNHLTANANDVLLGASDLCEQLRHAKVEPCHVAYQLFAADAQGIGAQILQRADIDGAAVKGLLRELIDSLTAG
jgi:ATP-dependent Clp protease ATP-binding subunit ClpA